MSPAAYFRRLNAPLRNQLWSWGSVDAEGQVFLRVWQDEHRSEGGKRFIRLINHREYRDENETHGYRERLTHIEALKNGRTGYLVMCLAVDAKARPRAIKSFDQRDVLRIGGLREFDGDEWAEIAERVPVLRLAEIRQRTNWPNETVRV